MSHLSRWNPALYKGSAQFYRHGRLPYAPGLPEALAGVLSLDGRGRLIDVGCGPGTIALTMAGLFQEVVGVDADADMIAEAVKEGRRTGASNVRWINLKAEEMPADLGSFRVATFAQSFHWMDRVRVAATMREMLEPRGGALVHVHAYTVKGVEPHGPMPHPRPPREEIHTLIARHLESNPQAQRLTAEVHPDDEDALLSDAGYSGPEIVPVPDDRIMLRTIDDIVASVYSSAPHLFGSGLAHFDAELRGLLSVASPSGLFSEQTGANQLRIWRPQT